MRSNLSRVRLGVKLAAFFAFFVAWAAATVWAGLALLQFVGMDWMRSPLSWAVGIAFLLPVTLAIGSGDLAAMIRTHDSDKFTVD